MSFVRNLTSVAFYACTSELQTLIIGFLKLGEQAVPKTTFSLYSCSFIFIISKIIKTK
jgi:hypothetical protein